MLGQLRRPRPKELKVGFARDNGGDGCDPRKCCHEYVVDLVLAIVTLAPLMLDHTEVIGNLTGVLNLLGDLTDEGLMQTFTDFHMTTR